MVRRALSRYHLVWCCQHSPGDNEQPERGHTNQAKLVARAFRQLLQLGEGGAELFCNVGRAAANEYLGDSISFLGPLLQRRRIKRLPVAAEIKGGRYRQQQARTFSPPGKRGLNRNGLCDVNTGR